MADSKQKSSDNTRSDAALPESAHSYARSIAKDHQKAESFLKRAGIITKAGELAPAYR